ncbi:uncharacterized protein TrAFT101_011537 [Trichoderma asperellum]|uniref:uncharacterized protein n=1 Tax=Trichoderma asperellum TaxID=101201 RepID=UPI00331E78AA|nr:hypothetical protein TrAFT101_011537 [Trichoderma asperellum]
MQHAEEAPRPTANNLNRYGIVLPLFFFSSYYSKKHTYLRIHRDTGHLELPQPPFSADCMRTHAPTFKCLMPPPIALGDSCKQRQKGQLLQLVVHIAFLPLS